MVNGYEIVQYPEAQGTIRKHTSVKELQRQWLHTTLRCTNHTSIASRPPPPPCAGGQGRSLLRNGMRPGGSDILALHAAFTCLKSQGILRKLCGCSCPSSLNQQINMSIKKSNAHKSAWVKSAPLVDVVYGLKHSVYKAWVGQSRGGVLVGFLQEGEGCEGQCVGLPHECDKLLIVWVAGLHPGINSRQFLSCFSKSNARGNGCKYGTVPSRNIEQR